MLLEYSSTSITGVIDDVATIGLPSGCCALVPDTHLCPLPGIADTVATILVSLLLLVLLLLLGTQQALMGHRTSVPLAIPLITLHTTILD